MAFTKPQLISGLRRALKARGLLVKGDHQFPGVKNREKVDLYLPERSVVVQFCARPTKTSLKRLLRHRRRVQKTYYSSSGKARFHLVLLPSPIVVALLPEAPAVALQAWCDQEGIQIIIVSQEGQIDDLAGEVVSAIDNRVRAPRPASTAQSTQRARHESFIEDSSTIGFRLDKLHRDCRDLVSSDTMALLEQELNAAEEESRHEHHPGCLLHLARATEALVTHLAKAWEAHENIPLLAAIEARQKELDALSASLWQLWGAEPSVKQRFTAKARSKARTLVEGVFDLVMTQDRLGQPNEEVPPTIQTSLNAIEKRWKLPEVRAVFKAMKTDETVKAITDLRNRVAHAPTSIDDDFEAAHVSDIIEAVQKLVDQLKIMHAAITPHLTPTSEKAEA